MADAVKGLELGKETRKELLDALKGIKAQLSQARQRESTAKGVAADVIASGGGPFSAAREAIGFKVSQKKAQIKRALDPLNIVNRLTGSKLATAIAGRLMFRSEKAIRSAAGLTPRMEEPDIEPTSPVPQPTFTPSTTEGVTGQRSVALLEAIASSVAICAKRVTAISDKLGATPVIQTKGGKSRDLRTGQFVSNEMIETEKEQRDFLKNIWKSLKTQEEDRDEDRDRKVEEDYESKFNQRKASIVTSASAPKQESGSGLPGMLSGLGKFLIPALAPLAIAIAPAVAALGLLGVAAKMVYDKWDDFKLALKMVKESVIDFYQTIVSTVSSIKEWIGTTITSGGDAIIDAGRSVVKSVRGFFGKGQTEEEERVELEKEAAAGSGYAQRKLAKEIAPPQKMESAATVATKNILSTVPNTLTQEDLQDSTLKQKAIDQLTGKQIEGTSQDKTKVNVVSRAVAQTYKETYGKYPSQDKENRETRLPSIAETTVRSLATQVPATPPAPTPVAPAPPQTGSIMTRAADMRAEASMATGGQAGSLVNQVNNARTTMVNNTLASGVPATRKNETSFVRFGSREFAPQ